MASPASGLSRFRHYRLLDKIGAGGMGQVYRARDEHLDREVAIKVLPPGLLADDAARKRFRQEALSLSRLSHPNIATIHDFDTEAGVDFLVMEYIAGETLSDTLQSRRFTEKEIVQFGIQMAEGLKAAHEQGVVHRDLKPGNVRITGDNRVKILDFGLAKLVQPETPSAASLNAPTESLSGVGSLAGTLPYMAPEQLREEKLDGRTDIWAAGAVLYEMSTAQPPFCATAAKLIEKILHEEPTPPSVLNPRLSPGLEGIILKCLDKDPDSRYQSAKELAVDLRRLAAPASTGSAPPVRRRLKSRVRSFAIAVVMVMMIAAIVVLIGPTIANRGPAQNQRRDSIFKANPQRLVVLPLANLSGDPEEDYFSSGITESLTAELAQIKSLTVISSFSARQYKRGTRPLPQVAKELNADALVEGSVQRSGNRVAINVQLVDASDRLLLARSFEREQSEVLALQREVARAIAGEIRAALTPADEMRLASAPAVNPAAYEAFLKGQQLRIGTNEQRHRAKVYFEKAIGIEPNFAAAYAGLADNYWSNAETDPRVAMPLARQNALKAIELDPALSHAHKTMASIHFYGDWDWGSAEKEFKRAIELNRSDMEAHLMYSVFLSAMGRADEALAEGRFAQDLAPSSTQVRGTLGWDFYFLRRYPQAVDQCQSALELDPNHIGALSCLGSTYIALGESEKAIAACERAVELSNHDPVRAVPLGRAYALAGRKGEARQILEQLRQASKHTYVPPYFFAELHAALGEPDQAFAWLAKAYEGRDRYLVWLKADEAFDSLRADPRFQSLLRRVGL